MRPVGARARCTCSTARTSGCRLVLSLLFALVCSNVAWAAGPDPWLEVERAGELWWEEGTLVAAGLGGVWRREAGGSARAMEGAPKRDMPLLAGRGSSLVVGGSRGPIREVDLFHDGRWVRSPRAGRAHGFAALALTAEGGVLAADRTEGLFSWAPGEVEWSRVAYKGWGRVAADLVLGPSGDPLVMGHAGISRSKRRPWVVRIRDGVVEDLSPELETGAGVESGWFDATEQHMWLATSRSELVRLDLRTGSFELWPLPVAGPLGGLTGQRDPAGLTLALRGSDDVLLFREGQTQRVQIRTEGINPARNVHRDHFRAPVLLESAGVHLTTDRGLVLLPIDPEGWQPLRPGRPLGVRLTAAPHVLLGTGAGHRWGGGVPSSPAFDLELETRLFIRFNPVLEGTAYRRLGPRLTPLLTPVVGFSTGVGAGVDGPLWDKLGSLGIGAGVAMSDGETTLLWTPSFVAGKRGTVGVLGVANKLSAAWMLGLLRVELAHEVVVLKGDPQHELAASVGTDLLVAALVALVLAVGD
jgi:hypothetical protein